MRVLAFILLLCLTQAAYGQWLRCNFAQDTNVSIVMTPQGCQSETQPNRTCLSSIYPGLPITFGECIVNDNPPQLNYKANILVYSNTSNSTNATIDYQQRYDTNGYAFSDWINDIFIVYWNDTGSELNLSDNSNSTSNSTQMPDIMMNDLQLDALGHSIGPFRVPVQDYEIEILVANYITRLAAEGGDASIQVVIGDALTGNWIMNHSVMYAGWGANYLNRFIVNYTEMIPLRVYGPNDCIGQVEPLWNGYINATQVHNETVIAFFGDYLMGDIYALYGRKMNFTEKLVNTTYTVCNFVNDVVNGTVEPQDNVTMWLGGFPGYENTCGYLINNIDAGVIPYGTCVQKQNGPAPLTTVKKILWIGEPTMLPSSNSTLNNTGNFTDNLNSTSTAYMVFNDTVGIGTKQTQMVADGKDFLIAYFVDHYHISPGQALNDTTNADFTVEHPREDDALIYQTRCFINGSVCTGVNETIINGTWLPTNEYQTYVVGTYASNWIVANLNASDFNSTNLNSTDTGLNFTDISQAYVAVAFNMTWWTVCPVSTYDSRSCVITVPDTTEVWNITLYNAPCYVNPDNCPEYYVDSTLVNFGSGSVGLVAWFGDWLNQAQVVTYNEGGILWDMNQPANATSSSSSSSSSSSTGATSSSSSSTGLSSSSTGLSSSSTGLSSSSTGLSSSSTGLSSSSTGLSSSSTGLSSSSSSTGM